MGEGEEKRQSMLMVSMVLVSRDLKAPIKLNPGERFIFTVDRTHNRETQSNLKMTQVNYDSFANEAEIGDILLIDGGML